MNDKKMVIDTLVSKVNKEYSGTWDDVADDVSLVLPYARESIRKLSPGIKFYHDYLQELNIENATQEQINELNEKIIEVKKVMTKNQDIKTYINRESKKLGRVEHLIEVVKNEISELNNTYPIMNNKEVIITKGSEMCLLCSDWHLGAEFKNAVNTFNLDIAKERINKLVKETIHIGKLNNVKTVNVVGIGDLLNGVIKTMVRIESREGVANQVVLVSSILSEILVELSNEFDTIKFYLTSSNHERIFQDKHENTPEDSFHVFIKEFIKLRLVNVKNVHIIDNKQDESFALIPLGNKIMVASHGDKDKKGASINRYSQILGFTPDYIALGHHHSPYEAVEGKCVIIGNGSLMGSNQYAVDLRLYSKPMQKVLIFDDSGELKSVNHVVF